MTLTRRCSPTGDWADPTAITDVVSTTSGASRGEAIMHGARTALLQREGAGAPATAPPQRTGSSTAPRVCLAPASGLSSSSAALFPSLVRSSSPTVIAADRSADQNSAALLRTVVRGPPSGRSEVRWAAGQCSDSGARSILLRSNSTHLSMSWLRRAEREAYNSLGELCATRHYKARPAGCTVPGAGDISAPRTVHAPAPQRG